MDAVSEAAASNRDSETRFVPVKAWKPGQSGNPAGRPRSPVDIAELARRHGPKCIEIAFDLATNSSDDRVRLAAVVALLDRGFGRPVQALAVDTPETGSLTMLHLVAAKQVAEQMQALLAAGVKPGSFNGNGHAYGNGNGSNGHDRTIDGLGIDYSKPALE